MDEATKREGRVMGVWVTYFAAALAGAPLNGYYGWIGIGEYALAVAAGLMVLFIWMLTLSWRVDDEPAGGA